MPPCRPDLVPRSLRSRECESWFESGFGLGAQLFYLTVSSTVEARHQPMSFSPQHVDLLDPPTLARTLTSRAATQQACAAGTATSTTDADATATRTALAAAEKCVALLRAKLIDDNAGGSDDAELPSAKRRAVEREGGQVAAVVSSAIATSTAIANTGADTNHVGTGTTTLASTRPIHRQQPDGTWVTTVVPCAPRESVSPFALVDVAACGDGERPAGVGVGLLEVT